VRKCASISISLIVLLSYFVVLFTLGTVAQDTQDAVLYFYGDGEGNETLDTDVPIDPNGCSMDVGPTAGILIMWIVGTFETVPFQKDAIIDGNLVFNIWVEQTAQTPGLVEFNCDILIDGQETGYTIENERMVITDEHEITFGGYVNLHVYEGSVLAMYLCVLYSGVDMTVYWASQQHPSHVIVPADWCSVYAQNPVIDEEEQTAEISANVIHALGTDEYMDYQLDIEGPSSASYVWPPNTTVIGNVLQVTWEWDYGKDEAEEGYYTVIITVMDKSENTWYDVTSLQIYYVEPPPPPPPQEYNWTTVGRITSSPFDVDYSSITQDSNGTFWLVYSQYEGYNREDIYIKKSKDGINWGLSMELWGNYSYKYHPTIIQDSNGIYWVAWASNWGGRNRIWITHSTDGENWVDPLLAIGNYYDNYYPSLIQDSEGRYWMAWTNYNRTNYQHNIYLTYSCDGIYWDEQPTKITSDYDHDELPSLIQDSSGIFRVAFASDRSGNYDIWLTSSYDPRTSWSSPLQLTTDYSTDTSPSLIENADGGFNISWESRRTGRYEIWHSGSPDWSFWYHPEQVTENDNPNSHKHSPTLIQDQNETLWTIWSGQYSDSYNIWSSYKKTNYPPSVSIMNPTGEKSGDVTIIYSIRDNGSDKCNIKPMWSSDCYTFYDASQGTGGEGVTDLSSSASGITHKFVWDSETDIPGKDISSVYFKITACDCQLGEPCTTSAFHVDNNKPPEIFLESVENVQSRDIKINYTISDLESDTLSVFPEYSTDGSTYYQATISTSGYKIKNLKSTPEGISYTFTWDSVADLGGKEETNVHLRMTPKDNDEGLSETISGIQLDNKPPTIISGPTVTSKTHDIAIITWETDEPSDSVLYWGLDTNYGNVASGLAETKIHTITLQSLSSETTYHYYVCSKDLFSNGPSKSEDNEFTTDIVPNELPIIIITEPINGEKVSGKITITGEAMDPDDDSLEFVEVKVDENEWEKAEGTIVWNYELNTKELVNGNHYLHARTYDGRNYSEEFSISIEVDNEEEEESSIWLLIVIGAICACVVAIILALLWGRPRGQETSLQGQQVEFIPYMEPQVATVIPLETVEPMVEETSYMGGEVAQPYDFEGRYL